MSPAHESCAPVADRTRVRLGVRRVPRRRPSLAGRRFERSSAPTCQTQSASYSCRTCPSLTSIRPSAPAAGRSRTSMPRPEASNCTLGRTSSGTNKGTHAGRVARIRRGCTSLARGVARQASPSGSLCGEAVARPSGLQPPVLARLDRYGARYRPASSGVYRTRRTRHVRCRKPIERRRRRIPDAAPDRRWTFRRYVTRVRVSRRRAAAPHYERIVSATSDFDQDRRECGLFLMSTERRTDGGSHRAAVGFRCGCAARGRVSRIFACARCDSRTRC
jgi:hypothetical protein